MKKIGITGGIGSGKSVICQFLDILSYPVYNTDVEAKRLMNQSPLIREKLTQLLGADIYKQRKLNREKMAQLIFSDSHLLQQVNSIVHPEVRKDFDNWSRNQTTPLVFLESAILFESGFASHLDKVWTVTAAEDIRISRVMERDHLDKKQINDRIRAQSDDTEKCAKSDAIIINDGLKPVIPQVFGLINAELNIN